MSMWLNKNHLFKISDKKSPFHVIAKNTFYTVLCKLLARYVKYLVWKENTIKS